MDVAERIQLSQTWWSAAEVVRRHPELTLRGDDHMTYLTLTRRSGGDSLAAFNPSTIHVWSHDKPERAVQLRERTGVVAASDPRTFVKQLERALGLDSPTQAPRTTPHALVFRFVSALLAAQVNDRHRWDCRNEVASEEGDLVYRGWIASLPEAKRALAEVRLEGWEWGIADRHFWGLTRDEKVVALLSTEGVLYRQDRQVDLVAAYASTGRRLLPLLASSLGDNLV